MGEGLESTIEQEHKQEVPEGRVENIDKCTECNSSHIVRDYERGELYCEECGLVLLDNIIDQGRGWSAFSQEERDEKTQTGSPSTFVVHDKGLSTEISWKNRDSSGKKIPVKNLPDLYRLRKWQKRIRVANSHERNLTIALDELNRIASIMGLSKNVRENAALIYRKAVDKNLIRGRSINGVMAAMIYAACRQNNVPRTLDEIADVSKSERKEIGRSYRFIVRELKIKIEPTSPLDYISRFCSSLHLSEEVRVKTIDLLKEADDKNLIDGRGPTGLVGAGIYIATLIYNERRTQGEIADVVGVTEVTIRNRYRELTTKLEIDI